MRPTAEPWRVTLVDTGEDTHDRRPAEADRALCRRTSRFCLTYGDGVADVDIGALIAFHRAHGKQATVTAVHAARPLRRAGAATAMQVERLHREAAPAMAA